MMAEEAARIDTGKLRRARGIGKSRQPPCLVVLKKGHRKPHWGYGLGFPQARQKDLALLHAEEHHMVREEWSGDIFLAPKRT